MDTKTSFKLTWTECFHLGAIGLMAIALGCHYPMVENSDVDASVKQKTQTNTVQSPKLSDFGPLTYFEQSCARCHGTNGANYGDTFGENLNDQELHQMVDDMAAGPGGAPLESAQLDIQVAFHRSLVDKHPFLIVNRIDTDTIEGEVMPESEVILIADGIEHQATVQDHRWRCELPAGFDFMSGTLVATRHGAKTEIQLSQASFSHSIPLN